MSTPSPQHRGMSTKSAHPPAASMSQSMLNVNSAASAGAKRPRTITAQADALMLQHSNQTPARSTSDQVVVGITATTGDDLEDWTEDFMELTPRTSTSTRGSASTSARNSERFSGGSATADTSAATGAGSTTDSSGPPRLLRSFTRSSSSLFHRPTSSFGRRSWHRQRSFDAGHTASESDLRSRNSRIRRSSNDATDKLRPSSSLGLTNSSSFVDTTSSPSTTQQASLTKGDSSVGDSEDYEDEDDGDDEEDAEERSVALTTSGKSEESSQTLADDENDDDDENDRQKINTSAVGAAAVEEEDSEMVAVDESDDEKQHGEGHDAFDDDDDEDWDVEFGFAEPPDDDHDEIKPGGGGFVDADRRRSDNFNIFLRGFHDMMAGEDLMDDDDESMRGSGKKGRNSMDEPLFQRRRSDLLLGASMDGGGGVSGSVDGALRSSLTSLPGASTEYALVDKYRLLDVACSSSYAVRIERYPKPCATYSELERSATTATQFPLFTDNRLEQWLANVVRSKCAAVNQLMTQEQANTPNPRHQKNHQFRTLVSIPFGKRFVDKCFKQISVYRFYGEEKSNRELVRVFFEKLATAGIADEQWASKLSQIDLVYIAGIVMEVLQEAARLYGPVPASGTMTPPQGLPHSMASSAASHATNAIAYWMRQFQTILTICVDAFPTYRHLIALLELRFVCHHLVGLASSDLSYSWQVCNQYPVEDQAAPQEPLAGQAAPIIANEILQFYKVLLMAVQAEIDTSSPSMSAAATTGQSPSRGQDLVVSSLSPVESSPALASPAVVVSSSPPCAPLPPSRYCTSTAPRSLLALIICDIDAVYSSRSALAEALIPELSELFEFDDDDGSHSFHEYSQSFSSRQVAPLQVPMEQDDPTARLLSLLHPSSSSRRRILEEELYNAIDLANEPLVKAKCCAVLSNMHSAAAASAVSGGTPRHHLKLAETLAYEALRILEWVTTKRIAEMVEPEEDEAKKTEGDEEREPIRKEPVSSVFANDGLLSDLGREILESLGNTLVANHKYRYGILCLEAATEVFRLLNQGKDHDRMDRLMCTLTTQADDVPRALPLHEKVAASCLKQNNANEYVFLTQALTNLWLREGQFSRAEDFLLSSFLFLRYQTSVLPPFYLASVAAANASGSGGSTGGSHSVGGSEALSSSSRSGTVLTTSSSTSSSGTGGGSFIYGGGGRGNTSEVDLWLTHDLTLHLLLRDLYKASGRFIEAMRVLEYLLNYSARLPRGKRTQLRMLLAEDSLQLRVLDTTRYMFHLLDQEANYFCDRLLQTTLGGLLGGGSGAGASNNSGGFGSNSGGGGGGPAGGGSSNGGRSMGGMGSESRFCFDMVLSVRYIVGRAKLYLALGDLRFAFAWLSLAQIKNERESIRTHAKLHVLDGRVMVELLKKHHEQRLFPEKHQQQSQQQQHHAASTATTVDEVLQSFASSLYALNKSERQQLRDRLTDFCEAVANPDKCMEMGVQSYWTAYDQYHALDDGHHQLKALLGVIHCQLVPIERSFFALGSSDNDELLVQLLGSCASVHRRSSTTFAASASSGTAAAATKTAEEKSPPRSKEQDDDEKATTKEQREHSTDVAGAGDDADDGDDGDDGDNSIENVVKTLHDTQRLLRQALSLSEQIAEPMSYFRTLVLCAQTWTWLERLAPYKSERPLKEAASFWEEAVKVLKAVFFRRVAFESTSSLSSSNGRDRKSSRSTLHHIAKSRPNRLPPNMVGGGGSDPRSTFSLVPILNFRENVILRLEAVTLQLIATACQLQQFDRVPEYVEDMLVLHMDELLSARMGLNSIAHQLRSFRSQQQHQSIVRHIPLHSVPGPTMGASTTSMGSCGGVGGGNGLGMDPITGSGASGQVAMPPTPSSSSRNSFSSPATPSGVLLPATPMVINASGTSKRKGHKKNQSMSSISELLASSSTGTHHGGATSSSFHDLSLSFVSASGRGTVLSGGATPRTGLASLSERSFSVSSVSSNSRPPSYGVEPGTPTSIANISVRSPRGGAGPASSRRQEEIDAERSRIRSRSAPQQTTPVAGTSRNQQWPNDVLSPVNESAAGVRVVDLKDVKTWPSTTTTDDYDFAATNCTATSSGTNTNAIGLYDFDDGQSEKLWWVFNAWRASKDKYISGKVDVSSFRHSNLKTLRMLLDAFDPQQVAVLYTNGGSKHSQAAGGILGFDVAHIHTHTLLEDRGFVLCVGYDSQVPRISSSLSSSRHSSRHSHHTHHLHRLDFKVFKTTPDRPSTWRHELPRADWYLSDHHQQWHSGAGGVSFPGDAVLRTLKLLGSKLLLKIVGLLLLENSLVVIGSSFPMIQEVTLSLLILLKPFKWQHTFLPFLPIPSWRFLADSLHHHVQAHQAGRPKPKMSLGLSASEWRWGSPRGGATAPTSTRSATSASGSSTHSQSSHNNTGRQPSPPAPPGTGEEEEATPFIIGTMADTWQTSLQRLRTSSIDERVVPAFVNVLDLDNIGSFAAAKSCRNAVSFPRKLRKQFMERFDKIVKIRRKMQEKRASSTSVAARHGSSSHRRDAAISSSHSSNSSSSHWHAASKSGATDKGISASRMAAAHGHASDGDDERQVYDTECATGFISGLHDFYDKLCALSVDRAKKMHGKKKHSKRQEIKSWFSSTHEFDAYVDKFLETSLYDQYKSRNTTTTGGLTSSSTLGSLGMLVDSSGVLSRSNSSSTATSTNHKQHALSAALSSSSMNSGNYSSGGGGGSGGGGPGPGPGQGSSLARSFGSVSSSTSSSFNGPPSGSHHHQL